MFGYDFTEQLDQRRFSGAELVHCSEALCCSEQMLVVGAPGQLDKGRATITAVVENHGTIGRGSQSIRPVRTRFDENSIPAGARDSAQFRYRPVCDQPAGSDDRHCIAEALDQIELVTGEDQRGAGIHVLAEHRSHRVDADRVETAQRLVQHQDVGSCTSAAAS